MWYRLENDKNNLSRCIEDGICPGDFVKVWSFGGVYSTYTDAFVVFFGDVKDDFHDPKNGMNIDSYIENGLYSNLWRVINIGVHQRCRNSFNKKDDLLCHLKDVYGRNLVVGMSYLRLFKRPSEIPKDKIILLKEL